MNAHSLENCISTLIQLRDVHSSQLDTSVLVELESVITDLQMVRDRAHSSAEVRQLMMRALQVIGIIVHIVTNLRDWLQ